MRVRHAENERVRRPIEEGSGSEGGREKASLRIRRDRQGFSPYPVANHLKYCTVLGNSW